MKALAAAVAIMQAGVLLADSEKFARAAVRWQRDRSLGSLLHVATSGLFLAEDVAALG
jgi:hypothetical protein